MTGSQGQDTGKWAEWNVWHETNCPYYYARCQHKNPHPPPAPEPQGQDASEALALAELLDNACTESDSSWSIFEEMATAVLAAGWVSPADHQRALAAERERIAEAIEALRPAHYGSEDEPHDTGFTRARDEAAHIARAAIARGNPHTEESP